MHTNNGQMMYSHESEDIEIKNEYSTFIEQLEETTEKLMNEVFNSEYRPQVDEDKEMNAQRQLLKNAKNIKHIERGKGIKDKVWYDRNYYANQNTSEQQHGNIGEGFRNFISRNRKWNEQKQKNIQHQRVKQIGIQDKNLTHNPQILRGSIEKLEPIYERALQLHHSKEKVKTLKRIQNKRKEQQQISSYSFHPEINGTLKPRSLGEYLRDKDEWNQKKLEKRQFRKLQSDAGKYTQCTFTPELVTDQYMRNQMNSGVEQSPKKYSDRGKQRVEERLLRSLQKICVMKVEN